MKIYFCTYGDENFYNELNYHIERSKACGFDGSYIYDRKWLEQTDFYRKNKKILDIKRGGGAYLWKPYVILHTMNLINDGDVVFYLSAGSNYFGDLYVNINSNITNVNLMDYLRLVMNEKDIILTEGFGFKNSRMTKRDAFVLMNCDEEKYWEASQLHAGSIVIKKTKQMVEIMEEYLMYCENENILTEMDNICGKLNLPDYNDHRYDQSVLTNLKIKYNLYSEAGLRNFIKFNFFDDLKRQNTINSK